MTMIALRGGPFDGQTRLYSDIHLGRLTARRAVVEHEVPYCPEESVLHYETVVYELRREFTEEYRQVYEAARQGVKGAMERRMALEWGYRPFYEEWLEYVETTP